MAKGIFCLETATWDENLVTGRQTSYEHLLRFLDISLWKKIPHLHYDVLTKKEFGSYLDKWKKQRSFPFLLLAFHGDEDRLDISGDDQTIFSAEITELLRKEQKNNSFIHFSSCYLVEKSKMEKLLYDTNALSVSCYMNNDGIGWHTSAAFELLFLTKLFTHRYEETEKIRDIGLPRSSASMRKFATSEGNKAMLNMGDKLGFHLWYCLRGKGNPGSVKHPRNIHAVPIKELKEKYGGS